MIMKCAMCENKKTLKKVSVTKSYKESGLDNITLIGVTVYKCDQCGEEYFNYGNMDQLHRLIAKVLLEKKGLLTGGEIRFLRKHIGYSGAMFAKLIGYEHETISRIETGASPVQPSFDRLVRFSVSSKISDRSYDLHDQILTGSGKTLKRIQLSHNSHGEWRIKSAA